MDVNVGNDSYSIKTGKIVRLTEHFSLMTEDKTLDLVVDITADFEPIPEKYHEVFINMLTSKYLRKVSYSDNPFSSCPKKEEKRWFQFWKTKK